jgi:hypothetical protein
VGRWKTKDPRVSEALMEDLNKLTLAKAPYAWSDFQPNAVSRILNIESTESYRIIRNHTTMFFNVWFQTCVAFPTTMGKRAAGSESG